MSPPSERYTTSPSTGTHHDHLDNEKEHLLKIHDKNDIESPRSVSTTSNTLGSSNDDEFHFDSEGSEESYFNSRKEINMVRIVKYVKYSCSTAILFYVIHMIVAGIYAVETPVAQVISPVAAFVSMWVLIIWLGMLEGGQGCLVGLQPIDRTAYEKSHPISYRCTSMVQDNEDLNRFIVGRQFLVVLVVFALNLCCTVVVDTVPGFPKIVIETFLASGLAVMLITVIMGQLSAEVTATTCMLDFINSRAILVTTWICLAIESSGLLHSVYLVRMFFIAILGDASGNSNTSSSEKRSITERFFFWARIFLSVGILTYVMVVTVSALLHDQTTMYEGVSSTVSLIIFIFLICFLGICEAMQIALFAVVNISDKVLEDSLSTRGKINYELAFRGDNFRAFLIGRQICVTMSMFCLAKLTTTNVDSEVEPTVLGMSKFVQDLFDTGLPGALITTIVASLAWRIIASTFPVEVMGNPVVYPFIRLCLLLEASGVFSSSWLLADILKKVTRFQHDEVYLGALIGGKNDHCHGQDIENTKTESYEDDTGDECVTALITKEDNSIRSSAVSNYGATTTPTNATK